MSAYMVDNSTIEKIMGYLHSENHKASYIARKISLEYGIQLNTGKQRFQFAKRLLAMNSRALYARYGDNGGYNIRSYMPFISSGHTHIQVYKAIQCFLYQCSEGKVPEETLYKLMEEVANYLAYTIVNSLPEYNQAKWG